MTAQEHFDKALDHISDAENYGAVHNETDAAIVRNHLDAASAHLQAANLLSQDYGLKP